MAASSVLEGCRHTSINGIAYSSDLDTISGIAYPVEEDMTPERPGRPAIGPMVNVRLPEDLTAWLDEQATHYGISRAEAIRLLLTVAREDGGNYGRGVIERILGKDAK